jgi:hypothetical protein
MSDAAPASVCYFRMRFLGPAVRLSFLSSLVTMTLIFLDDRKGAHDLVGWLIVRLFPIPLAVLFMGALTLSCPIRVSSRGIKCPGWPLLVREVPWDEMHSVQYVNLLGFRFLAIYREGAAFGLWLPLFLKNRDCFRDLVSTYVGGNHPLASNLTRHCN